jgi:hypothetical protein
MSFCSSRAKFGRLVTARICHELIESSIAAIPLERFCREVLAVLDASKCKTTFREERYLRRVRPTYVASHTLAPFCSRNLDCLLEQSRTEPVTAVLRTNNGVLNKGDPIRREWSEITRTHVDMNATYHLA